MSAALKSREEAVGPSVVRFLSAIRKLYTAARENGQVCKSCAVCRKPDPGLAHLDGVAWLTWEEWQLWADAAIRCGIVTEGELAADVRPRNAAEFRLAVLLTWERVMESRDLGRTAYEHHRREAFAMDAERRNRQQAEDASNAQRRAQLERPGSSKKLHHGASGEL